MLSEVTVILKDEEKTLRSKFLCYETYTVDPDNEILKDYIKQSLKTFGNQPEDIIVTIKMVVQ